MSIAAVVTRGYGTFGTESLVVTAGYGSGIFVPPVIVIDRQTTGNWKFPSKKKKKKKIVEEEYIYSQPEIIEAVEALPPKVVVTLESILEAARFDIDEELEEDDALLMSALTTIQ